MRKRNIIFLTAAASVLMLTACSRNTEEITNETEPLITTVTEITKEDISEEPYELSEAELKELAEIDSKIPEYYIEESYDTSGITGIPLDARIYKNEIWIVTYEDNEESESFIHVYHSDDLFKTPEETGRFSATSKMVFCADTFLSSEGVFSFIVYTGLLNPVFIGYADVQTGVHYIDSRNIDECNGSDDNRRTACYGDYIYFLFKDDDASKLVLRKYDKERNIADEKYLPFEALSDVKDFYLIEYNNQINFIFRKKENTVYMLPLDDFDSPEKASELGEINGEISTESNGEYQFYVTDDNLLYGCKITDNKSELTLLNDLSYFDIPTHDRIAAVTKDIVVYHDADYDPESEMMGIIRKCTGKEKLNLFGNKSIIKYVMDDIYDHDNFRKLTDEFNQKSDDYFFVQKYISHDQIKNQIEDKAEFDIFIYSHSAYCSEELADKGVFADMRPLIDSMTDIQFEDINPYISKLCTKGEMMYRFIPQYTTYPVYTNSSLYPERFIEYIKATGEKPVFIPVPSTDIMQIINPLCAISVMSDCKDMTGAQEFIKLCFSDEIQNDTYNIIGVAFPVTKDNIDKKISEKTDYMRSNCEEATEDEIKLYEDMLREFIYSPAAIEYETNPVKKKIDSLIIRYYNDDITLDEITEELKNSQD